MKLIKRRAVIVFLGLFVGVIGLAVCANWQLRATHDERMQTLAGNELIPLSIGAVNHAITIRRPARDVWPWLAQMGSGRSGWYAYDLIDDGAQRSAERILPELQNIGVGSVLPAVPGATDVFQVAKCDPGHSLVLAWRLPNGQYQTTWAFQLEQLTPDQTRLIVRGRVAPGYHPYGLPQWLALPTGRVAHFIMERKQLLGIARRAETWEP